MAKTKRWDNNKEKKKARGELMVIFDEYRGGNKNEEPDEKDPKVEKDGRGRPTIMTKQALQKLRDAFSFGCTDEEAAFYAGISVRTLYHYCEAHEDFLQEKEDLKLSPILAARGNVVKGILMGSVDDSWQYLRAKRKKEFAEMKQHEVTTKTLSEADIEQAEAEQFATMEAVTEDEEVTA